MTYNVELPGIYVDNLLQGATAAVFVANEAPERDSVEADKTGDILLQIMSTTGNDVDRTHLKVLIEGITAYDAQSGGFQTGYDGANSYVCGVPVSGILLDDWDMEIASTSAWTPGSSATLTKQTGSPSGSGALVLRMAYNGTPYPSAYQTVLTSGHKYRCHGWARGDGTYAPFIMSDFVTVHWEGTASSSWQYFDFEFIANSTSLILFSYATAAGWAEFDEVHIQEIGSDIEVNIDHSITWDSEQVVNVEVTSSQTVLADGDTEYNDVLQWTVGNSATLTKESGSATGVGSLLLRVAYNSVNDPYAEQTVLTISTEYRIRGWARGDGTAVPQIYNPTYGVVWTGTSSTAWQYFDVTWTADSTDIQFFAIVSSAGYVEWDSIVIEPTPSPALDAWEYTFTVEDYIVPTVVFAMATGPQTIQVVFSEGMKAISASGADDALNPALYEIEYDQADVNIAAVAVVVTGVTQVSATTYAVATDIPLTFGKPYIISALGVADDSTAGNATAAPDHDAAFTSWSPTTWPARRSFDFYGMFSSGDHTQDTSGDLEKTCSLFQDIIDILLWKIDSYPNLWDTDKADETSIDAMLQDHGNPFELYLSLSQKKKLLELLVPIFLQKGTKRGIINLARMFLGLEITDIIVPWEDTWILGDSERGLLGDTTVLGPSLSATRFSFWIVVDRALTDEERVILDEIVRQIKVAHEHSFVQEPTAPDYIDHWCIGMSELGENTYLH